jgi:hypothetical protein
MPAFVLASTWVLGKKGGKINNWQTGSLLAAAAIIVYLVLSQEIFDAQFGILVNHKVSAVNLWAHWGGAICVGLLFYRLAISLSKNADEHIKQACVWLVPLGIVTFLSLEVCVMCNQLFYSAPNNLDAIQTVYIKVGLPILWGLSSFALMMLGMRFKDRGLRIVSLTLFSVTLFKLFVFDIRDIPPAGKIAAFFCLGVLLLIISFMYQRVKKIIIDDAKPKDE